MLFRAVRSSGLTRWRVETSAPREDPPAICSGPCRALGHDPGRGSRGAGGAQAAAVAH